MAGKDSLLDRLLAPPSQGDPLDEQLRDDAAQRAAAALAASRGDPETVAKANRIARETGLPLSTAERMGPAIERQVSIRRAVKDAQSSGYLSDWFADPVRAAVGKDDTEALKALSAHFRATWKNQPRPKAKTWTQRAWELANTDILAAVGLDYGSEGQRRAEYRRDGGWFDRADALIGVGRRQFQAGLERATSTLSPFSSIREASVVRARAYEETAQTRITGTTDWSQVKAKPTIGNIAAFGTEQTIQSLPGMAAAALALPAYIASQAGNIGQSRAENNGRTDASLGDVVKASPAAVASALLERIGIKGILGSTGANVVTRVGKAAAKEAATEALQSDIEYAGGSLGTDRGFDSATALDQMAAGAVGGLFGGGGIRGLQEVGGGVRTVVQGAVDRRRAAEDAALLDVITEGAAATKLKQRDPEMLRQFLEGLTEDTPVENVYLPASAVRQLFQDGYRDDPFFGDYADQIDEALAHDGDIVLPTADLAARLAGTPAWEQLKGEARFSPGGISRSEAESFNDEVADLMTEAVEQAAERLRADAQAAEPRQKLYGAILSKLTDAQFTPDVARQYAELLTARTATRAARLGEELTGREFDELSINRVLPESLRPIVATSELDLVIQAMRRGRVSTLSNGGQTLLEWIAARGGIIDVGGDIASMGGNRWHLYDTPRKVTVKKGRSAGKERMVTSIPGRRKLIRDFTPGQGDMLGGEATGTRYGLDETLNAAIEAGFFPELQRSGEVAGGADTTTYADKADVAALLEAIDEELRGNPRRAAERESDRVRELAEELEQLLDRGGLDATTATDTDIKNFVQRFQAAAADGRSYSQQLLDDARPERSATNFREARSAVAVFQGKPIRNAETGMVARVSRNAVDKMLSGKAVAKSTSARDHSLAVANADKLFANALLNESHADTRGDMSVEAVHRFVAPMLNAEGEVLAVKLTVKEFAGTASSVLYTIETIEVDESGEARLGAIQPSPVQASASEQSPSVAPPGFSPKVASMLAAVKGAASGRTFDQFAGVRAKTAPLDDLGRARELEQSGADADTIKSETNWHRGDDGKWRWEIDDSGAKLRDDVRAASVGDVLPLSEIIDHPVLFEAYPGLANLPVEVIAGAGGRYNGRQIEIGERNLWEARRPNNEGLGVILHEVQHVIQMWERFASGGPSNPEGLRAAGFADALDAEIERLRAEQTVDGPSPEGWATAGGLEDSQVEATAARNVYRRIAGEVEARNTQSRRDMSADARRDAGERWTRDTAVADVLFPRRMLDQTYESGARGRITFQNEKRVIELFAKADLSTLIHEAAGHDWLEQLQADAARAVEGDGNAAARQLFADWETVKAWFAANGHPVGEDGVIPVEAHEMWARGVERYVMEGKSPTPALRRVFDAFRSWLISIYQVVDNLRSPITPEIREVMDRLIATDEELALAREEQRVSMLFDSAEQAGMTGAEFEAYRQAAEDSRSEAFDALLARTMRAVRASRTAEFRAIEGGVRRDVTEEVDARPVFKALAMLRDRANGVRLDRQWLIDTYGADALDLMPKSVPPIYAERGTPADEIAPLTGFATGDEMVRTLMGVETRRKEMRAAGDNRAVRQSVIDEETRAVMFDRYGDPLNDGSIEREAREVIHNDRQGDVIAAELRALQRIRRAPSNPDQSPTPYAVAKRWAAQKVATGIVNDVSSRGAIQQHLRAARRAASAAEQAMLAGDVDEAFRHKQAQMLNNALAAEGKRAADEVEAAVARLSKIAKRRTMKSVDQDYLEQAHALLEQVELKDRSQRSLERQASFEAWARQREAEGYDVVVPASFGEALGTTNWSRLPVERLLGLDAAVSQIMHLGRLKQTLIDAKEEREFEAVVRDAEAAAAKLPQKPPSNLLEPSRYDQIKAGIADADAALLKMETVFDWLDGGDSDGVFNRTVFRPIANAQDNENAMLADYLGRIKDAFAAVPETIARRWSEQVVPGFINRDTGEPMVMTRQSLVAMALNIGNEGNIQRLTDGYGWPETFVRDVLNRELDPSEWQFVQRVWDIIDTLWPQIAAMERRVNGVEPEKVEAKPVETPSGALRGGYYPAIYDTNRSYRDEQFRGEAGDLLEGAYTRATTRASATKERSEKVQRPLKLDLGVINRHLGEVIHDLTHREAVINAWKFLGNERVMRAVDQSLGRSIRQQFKPWLRFVANRWAMERAGNEGAGKFLNGIRSNVTIVGMGFRVSTMMMQIAGYSNSFEYVGARWVAPEIARFVAQLTGKTVQAVTFQGVEMPPMMAFAMERSGELRTRMDTLDRDIRVSLDAMRGKRGSIWDVKRFMFHGIGYMDRIVSVPTWVGAYNKAVAAGASEADAVYAADKAVRLSQGASSAKDMAAIQRGTGRWGEALKFFTMFYTYLSAFHQRQRTFGRDVARVVREGDYRATPALIARAWWLFFVPPILAELLAGRGPDEEEDWGWWAFRKMLFQSLGPMPLVRDLGEPLYAKAADKPSFGYALSPMQKAGESVVNVGGDIGNLIEGDDTTRATRNALEATGYATGLVPGQVATAAQFLVDVGYGEQDPETVAEWWEGLTKGKVSEKK